jgi:hypothetical protein
MTELPALSAFSLTVMWIICLFSRSLQFLWKLVESTGDSVNTVFDLASCSMGLQLNSANVNMPHS